jgi:nicotinamidase/pyrazinamidase
MSWPKHCVQGTPGSALDYYLWAHARDTGKPILLVHKGDDKDREAYSGFQGKVVDAFNFNNYDLEQDFKEGTRTLAQALNLLRVTHVKIGGLALDYCVKATAIDSRSHFGDTTVLMRATRPVDYLSGVAAIVDLTRAGVRLDNG